MFECESPDNYQIIVVVITVVFFILFFVIIFTMSFRKSPKEALNEPSNESSNEALNESSKETAEKLLNDDYQGMSGGGYRKGHKQQLNTKVQILTQRDFRKLKLSDYWILDKFDGINKTFKNDDFEILYEETRPINSSDTFKFVFDVLKSNGKSLRNLSFEERMKSEVPEGFIKKPFVKMESKEDLLNRLNGNKTDTIEMDGLTIPVDGLILQSNMVSYKLKKTYMNTVDFKMYYDNGKINLFTLNRDGSSFDKFFNPFFDNNVCYLNEEPPLNQDISERFMEELRRGYEQIRSNAQSVSGMFGEFSNIGGKWYFLRLRDHPNSSLNAIKIASLIYSPIHTSEGYFNKVDNNNPLAKSFHEMSHALRKKTFDIIHKESPNAKRLLDIACGRGGDIKEANRIGIVSTIGIDSDKDALVEYALKRPFTTIISNNIITKQTLAKMDGLIKKRLSFIHSDICLINFAIHYLTGCLPELKEFIKNLTQPNSKTYITFFDSDAILKDIVDNKIQIGELTISIENGQLKMPMPTISKDGYMMEPMVNKTQLKLLGKNIVFKSLEMKSSEAKGFEKIAKYTKYIKLAIIDN